MIDESIEHDKCRVPANFEIDDKTCSDGWLVALRSMPNVIVDRSITPNELDK